MEKKSTGRGRGRPEHQPTPALRRKVSIAAGGGMRHEDIALALGISRPTLEKHYALELSKIAFERRIEALQGLHKAAVKGSSSAAKAFLGHEPELAAPPAGAGAAAAKPAANAPAAAPAPAAKVGKKEAANSAATTAQVGTDWDGLLPGSAAVN